MVGSGSGASCMGEEEMRLIMWAVVDEGFSITSSPCDWVRLARGVGEK